MFTSNQIEEIRKKLQLEGVKDSSLPEAHPLTGKESISIVQSGQNRKVGLDAFITSINNWCKADFLNLSKEGRSYTVEGAIAKTSPAKLGQIITFSNKKTGSWSIYQYTGETLESWNDVDSWANILDTADYHFRGYFFNEELLKKNYPRPQVGDFAFIGTTLEEAVTFTCISAGNWYNTNYPALTFADKFKSVYSEDFGIFDAELEETLVDRANKDAVGNVIHTYYASNKSLQETVSKEAIRAKAVEGELQTGINRKQDALKFYTEAGEPNDGSSASIYAENICFTTVAKDGEYKISVPTLTLKEGKAYYGTGESDEYEILRRKDLPSTENLATKSEVKAVSDSLATKANKSSLDELNNVVRGNPETSTTDRQNVATYDFIPTDPNATDTTLSATEGGNTSEIFNIKKGDVITVNMDGIVMYRIVNLYGELKEGSVVSKLSDSKTYTATEDMSLIFVDTTSRGFRDEKATVFTVSITHTEKSHETRIKELEDEIAALKEQIKNLGGTSNFSITDDDDQNPLTN